MDFITEQDVFDYLGIDYADEVTFRRVRALVDAVDSYLMGAIGDDYATAISATSLAKAQELALMLIGELYEARGAAGSKERTVIRSLLSSMMLQLQIERESHVTNESDFESLRSRGCHQS